MHIYKTVWDPKVGDMLRLEREPTNSEDRFAVAVMDTGNRVVGHVSATTISNFLNKRSVNKGTVEVMGQ